MKILLISHHFPPESYAGTEIYTYNLAKELIDIGHEVTVFFSTDNKSFTRYDLFSRKIDNIPVFIICNYMMISNYRESYDDKVIEMKYKEILDIVNPDIVHIVHLYGLSFGIIKITKNRNIPMIISLKDYWFFCPRIHLHKKSGICVHKSPAECTKCVADLGFFNFKDEDISDRETAALSLLKEADIIISPSQFLKNKFLSLLNINKEITWLPNGIDTDRNMNIIIKKRKKIVFGYCGTVSREKGVHLILKNFEKLDKAHKKNTAVYITGNISNKDYENYMDLSFPWWRKYYHGPYRPEEIIRIIKKNIDVLILPSVIYENYPAVINEAYLSGIPVLGSSLGGIPEMIDEGDTGLLFDPFDENDLLNKMLFLIENPSEIDSMKVNISQKKIKNMREHALEMENIYKNLSYDLV